MLSKIAGFTPLIALAGVLIGALVAYFAVHHLPPDWITNDGGVTHKGYMTGAAILAAGGLYKLYRYWTQHE